MGKLDCKLLHNFKKGKDVAELPSSIWEATTREEAVNIIIKKFAKTEDGAFSLSKEKSSDPDSFEQSIYDLMSVFADLMSSKKHPNLDLSRDGDTMKGIIESLKLYYLAESLPENEEDSLEVIANMEKNEEEKVREKLNTALNRFFKDNIPARESFKKLVKMEIAARAIINLNSDDGIIANVEDLNQNIENLLNLKYSTVVKYLKSVGTKETFGLKVFPVELINSNHEIREDALDVLLAFYDLLNTKILHGVLLAEVELGWRLQSKGVPNLFLDALHSYLTVTYLDDLSLDSIGRYIGFNKDLKWPIKIDDTGTHYKYRFGVDKSNRVNSWGVDARDVLREMGNFTKFLIEMIPLVDPETGENTGESVTPVLFMNAFTLVFANTSKIKTKVIRDALISYSDNPVENLRIILGEIHSAINLHYSDIRNNVQESSQLYKQLLGGSGSDGVINVFDLKVLDSVYRTLFLGRRSLYNIEQRYNERKGLTSRYPLVETLASEIQASTAMYYLITRWDRNTESYVTEPKERFAEGNKFHNLRIAINKHNQINLFDDNTYKIVSKTINDSNEVYEIQAKDTLIRVTVDTSIKENSDNRSSVGNIYGIFTKRDNYNPLGNETVKIEVKGKDEDWKTFDALNKEVNLSSYNYRSLILDNRTGSNKTFLDVLDFIQLFTLLKFGADNKSLATYDIFRSLRVGLVDDLVVAATRGLVIANINKQFREFRADNPGVYTASQLPKFIEANNLASSNITTLSPNGKDYKTIWESTARGTNLLTFYSTEEWLKYYSKTLDIISGEISRANIKNASGDSLPNYGLMYEGANLNKVINDSQHKSREVIKNDLGLDVEIETFKSLSENIFAKDPDLVIETANDMEVTLKDGTSKSVKMMTDSELYYRAIYDKFILTMAKDRTAWILPTTYSDKVKYVVHHVKTTLKDIDLLTAPLNKIYDLFVSSLGYQYRFLLKSILDDFAKIYNLPESGFDVSEEPSIATAESIRTYVREIDRRLMKETEESLNAKVSAYNKLNPKNRIELTLDSHIRVLPKKYQGKTIEVLSFNGSLLNYALDVYTSRGIANRLRKERFYFMQDLLKGRFGIHHLPTKYIEAGRESILTVLTSHPVGKLLQRLNANNSQWVNNKGSLILARNNSTEDGIVTNIKDLKESSTLNPLLDRFFLIHSLLGNNLRMLHTGSELNHRNKELEKYNWTAKIGGILNEEIERFNLTSDKKLAKIEDASKLAVIKKFSPSLYLAIIQAAKLYNISAKEAERFWNTLTAENVRTIISFLPPEDKKPYQDLLELMLYETEATGQGAQLKRNVSIPATMRPYTPSMRGIGKTMNLAIMKDIRAIIYNINGDIDSEDAHDGAALINGVTSVHENWSLSENEVGTIKKPIWHSYNNAHGTAGLVKFAAHTLTNNLIRNSQSAVDLIKIDKKMNGWNWELLEDFIALGNNDSLNLLTVAAHNSTGVTTFKDLIGENNTEVFYEGTKGTYWAINNFDYEIDTDNEGNPIEGSYGTYVTTEFLSTVNGIYTGEGVKVYHYFNANSEHIKSDHLLTKLELLERGLHRAHSIYEFKLMFGGAYSMEKANNKLEYSEISNYIAANFINNVTLPTAKRLKDQENYNKKYAEYLLKYAEYLTKRKNGEKVNPPTAPLLNVSLDLDNFILPLKTNKIDYICNNSAIKNGAANRNESSRFYNDEDLDYITMSTEYYGILMDADHDADEAELTEFSQVISALDAGGRLHSYVTSIYKALGNIAILESKIEFTTILHYYKLLANISDDDPDKELKLAVARDKVYTVIGNTILANLSLGSSRSGLTDAIVKNIKREFNLTSSHMSDEELKLPFSDSNLYSLVLSTFASLVTKKSIRKQYPGIGAVISPAYDMLMVYDLDGEVYKFDDVLRLAKLLYLKWQKEENKENNSFNPYFSKLEETLDTTKWNKNLVEAFLGKKLDDLNRNAPYSLPLTSEPADWTELLQWFDPLLKVDVYYTGDNGVVGTELVDLSDIRTYYEFMANPANYLRRKLGNKTIKISSFKRVLTKGRNLAPSMISWKYKDGETLRRKNIYSSAILIKLFLNSMNKTQNIEGVKSAYEDVLEFYNREVAKDGNYKDVLGLLDDLAKGLWNGLEVEITNKEAELIMSNIYLTKFGIDHHVSLAEVLKDPKKYFTDKPKPQIYGGADSSFYDMVMMKANGRHSYISFDSSFLANDEDKYYTTYWKDRSLHREPFIDRRVLKNTNNKVLNEVYILDDDNHPLFKIGRDIIRTDLSYNSENKYFYVTNTHEKVSSKNLKYINDLVIEYVEFVSLNVYRKGDNKFRVFNINSEKIRYASNMESEEGLQGEELEKVKRQNDKVIYDQIQQIVKSLYLADSYEVLTLNDNRIKTSNVHVLKNILPGLVGNFSYDLKLSAYLAKLNGFINKSLPQIYVNEFTSRVILNPTRSKIIDGKKVDVKENRLGYAVDETTGDILLPAKSAAKGILRKQVNEYYQDLARRKLASFELSRYFTASRIPAQTLQSFMAMKLVAFTGEPGAQAYVSHWLTWLQGSDYDIDKAYIMGLAFNDNSSYIGWSTLFDYFDSKTLAESLNLPMGDPKANYTIEDTITPEVVDITEEIETIRKVDQRTKLHKDDTTSKEFSPYLNDGEESYERRQRIRAYIKILSLLELGKKVGSTSAYNKDVLKAIRNHNEVVLPPLDYSLALRNFISSHILGTVQNIRNLKDSYVPVSMGDLRRPADRSAKGQESKRITLLNPLSVYKMQRLNMIGKNVIAIAATGQKAAFMWNYYLNDVYNNAKEGVDYTISKNPETGEILLDSNGNPIIEIKKNSDLQFVQFSFISRILGPLNNTDSEGNKYTEIRTLPDVNFEKAMDSIKTYAMTHKLNPKRPIDIMISEMISAATDNAKELILAKINAGDNLAKCHLFLITLGFDIDEIVLFMTSDVVDWIDRISGQNIFLNQNKTVRSASSLIEDYLKYLKAIAEGTEFKGTIRKGDLNLVLQIVPNNLTIDQINNYLLYIDEFNNILDGANEFSNFGNLLKVNQGIPGKAEELQARLDTIKQMFDGRDRVKLTNDYEAAKYAPLRYGNFDPVKWLQDTTIKVMVPKVDENENIIPDPVSGEPVMEEKEFSYRLLTSEYYDKNKKTLNIFAAANHLPHFRNMFALMGSEYTVYNFSVKSKLLLKIVKDTREEIPGMFIDSRFYLKALQGADSLLIINYFKHKDFKFPVKARVELIKLANGTMGRVGTRLSYLDLATNVGRAAFKLYFETYIIPSLLAGSCPFLTDELNGEVSKNEFIRALIPSIDDHKDIWKLDLDMASESTYTITLLSAYSKALLLLDYVKINGVSLSDWFQIYNLIINRNRYGSDRLTKSFDYFINNYDSKFNSVINDYLRYIGELDKKDTNVEEEFSFNIMDMFIQQAKIVNDLGGLTDPVVIKLDEDNNFVYYIKKSKDSYTKLKRLVIKPIAGESPDDRLERFERIRNYFVLNNTHSDMVTATLEDLKKNPVETLMRLYLDGTLKVYIKCN